MNILGNEPGPGGICEERFTVCTYGEENPREKEVLRLNEDQARAAYVDEVKRCERIAREGSMVGALVVELRDQWDQCVERMRIV